MEQGAEHVILYGLVHLVGLLHALNVGKVELQRAVDVAIDGTGRQGFIAAGLEEGLQLAHHLGRLLYAERGRAGKSHVERHGPPLQGHPVVVVQLVNEAAHLARDQALGARIVQQEHPPGPVDEAVEVVGGQRVLMLGGGQVEAPAQVVGDETVLRVAAWEHPFVEGSDDEVLEVKPARFEHPHDLQPRQRLAHEGDGDARRELADEPHERIGRGVYPGGSGAHDVVHAVQHHIILVQEIQLHAVVRRAGRVPPTGLQLPQHAHEVRQEVARVRQRREYRLHKRHPAQLGRIHVHPVVGRDAVGKRVHIVATHQVDVLVVQQVEHRLKIKRRAMRRVPPPSLQFEHQFYQPGGRRGLQRKAHGHVHLVHPGRQRVNEGG